MHLTSQSCTNLIMGFWNLILLHLHPNNFNREGGTMVNRVWQMGNQSPGSATASISYLMWEWWMLNLTPPSCHLVCQ